MKKFKICKRGNGKAINFDGCNTERDVALYGKTNFKYGLGIDCGCYAKWLMSSDIGKDILSKTITQVKKPRLDLEIARNESKKNKSLAYLIQNTVNICHKFIRLRDKGKPCISCGGQWHSDFHAGHFYKAELYSSLKLEETNINGQCPKCNLFEEGNESGYRVGLINRYSKGFLSLLDSKALLEKKKGFKWNRIELNKIQKYYKNKIKEL